MSGSYAHMPLIADVLRNVEAPPEMPNHGRLLVFLDENNAQVMMRLSDKAWRSLKQMLADQDNEARG